MCVCLPKFIYTTLYCLMCNYLCPLVCVCECGIGSMGTFSRMFSQLILLDINAHMDTITYIYTHRTVAGVVGKPGFRDGGPTMQESEHTANNDTRKSDNNIGVGDDANSTAARFRDPRGICIGAVVRIPLRRFLPLPPPPPSSSSLSSSSLSSPSSSISSLGADNVTSTNILVENTIVDAPMTYPYSRLGNELVDAPPPVYLHTYTDPLLSTQSNRQATTYAQTNTTDAIFIHDNSSMATTRTQDSIAGEEEFVEEQCLYVADTGNNSIRCVSLSGYVTTFEVIPDLHQERASERERVNHSLRKGRTAVRSVRTHPRAQGRDRKSHSGCDTKDVDGGKERHRGTVLKKPTGIAYHIDDMIYVADTGNHRVASFNRHKCQVPSRFTLEPIPASA